MAIYSFQHDYISLKRHGPGRAAAGVRYISRTAAEAVIYINFSPNKYIAQREMQAIEDAVTRKDARITHTFIIALPKELDARQRELTALRYGMKLTRNGRGAAVGAVHTDKEHNPHLHLTLVDREVTFVRDPHGRMVDVKLGPSINKLTHSRAERMKLGLMPNATEQLRWMWEVSCNSSLEDFGIEARIDRRTLLEQGIDRQAEKHRGWQDRIPELTPVEAAGDTPAEPILLPPMPEMDLVDATERHSTPLAPEADETTLEPAILEGSMDEEIDLSGLSAEERAIFLKDAVIDREGYRTVSERIQTALKHDQERSRLRYTRDLMNELAEVAKLRLEEADLLMKRGLENELAAQEVAKDAMAKTRELEKGMSLTGGLGGVHVRLFGFEWKSAKRERAEQLVREVSTLSFRQDVLTRNMNEAYEASRAHSQAASAYVDQSNQQEHILEAQMAATLGEAYGDGVDFDTAENILAKSTLHELEGVSATDIFADYENGGISYEEAIRAAELIGDMDVMNVIEQRRQVWLEQEKEQDEGLSL